MSMPLYEPIGVSIRRRRRQLGLAQGELATLAGVSKPYLSLIETGKAGGRTSDKMAKALAAALEMDAADVRARFMLEGLTGIVPPELWPAVIKLVQEWVLVEQPSPRARSLPAA